LQTSDGATVTILTIEKSNKELKVYNIEVDGNHNYYVTSTRILVHNKNIVEVESLENEDSQVEIIDKIKDEKE